LLYFSPLLLKATALDTTGTITVLSMRTFRCGQPLERSPLLRNLLSTLSKWFKKASPCSQMDRCLPWSTQMSTLDLRWMHLKSKQLPSHPSTPCLLKSLTLFKRRTTTKRSSVRKLWLSRKLRPRLKRRLKTIFAWQLSTISMQSRSTPHLVSHSSHLLLSLLPRSKSNL